MEVSAVIGLGGADENRVGGWPWLPRNRGRPPGVGGQVPFGRRALSLPFGEPEGYWFESSLRSHPLVSWRRFRAASAGGGRPRNRPLSQCSATRRSTTCGRKLLIDLAMRPLERSHAIQPARQSVPTGAGLVHHTFSPDRNRLQVVERRSGCGGSPKALPVERNSLRKKQLLEPLSLAHDDRCGPA